MHTAAVVGHLAVGYQMKKIRIGKKGKGILVFLFVLSTIRSCFAKRVIKMTLAPLVELFVEFKKKHSLTGEATPCEMGPKPLTRSALQF